MSNYQSMGLDKLASRFKALGHPHRLEIFWRLAGCCVPGTTGPPGEVIRRCVGELATDLDIAPSTVSHHIKELTHAGLIATERCGREIRCWVEPELLNELRGFFANFIAAPSGMGIGGSCGDQCNTG